MQTKEIVKNNFVHQNQHKIIHLLSDKFSSGITNNYISQQYNEEKEHCNHCSPKPTVLAEVNVPLEYILFALHI